MTSAAHRADEYIQGVVTAIVVDNEDPLGEGRVRLTYPWLHQSMETEWCRVCQLYAGDGYGSFFVPEKNDEVLVSCVHGDLNEAIVLGGLYNGKDKPAGKREKPPGADQKLIRTKGKHQVLLEDTAAKKKLELKSSADQILVLDDQNNRIVIDTGSGQKISMEKNGNSITLSTTGGQSITLDGKGGITISGPTTIKLDGAKVDIGSAASQPALLGTLFMTMFSTHTHMLGTLPTSPPVPTGQEAQVISKTVMVQP